MKIIVVDSIMGSGKTNWAIRKMNDYPETNYVFCTPYVSEDGRIESACPRFVLPQEDEITKTKTGDLMRLIHEGKSVAITHELLKIQKPTGTFPGMIRSKKYTLIVDEELDVVEKIDITPHDMENLNKCELIDIDDLDHVEWVLSKYKGKYADFMQRITKQHIIMYREKLFALFPIELLKCFDEIIILTWQFVGSPMERYLRIHHMEYELFHIEDGNVVPGRESAESQIQIFKPHIHIYHGPLNDIGYNKMNPINDNSPLSASWWKNPKNRKNGQQILNNVDNLVRNSKTILGNKFHSHDLMWTCYKSPAIFGSQSPKIKGRYGDGFCPCNMRATNAYGTRTLFACPININADPDIVAWFDEHNAPIDKDQYALTQLMQLLWRSGIRNGKDIFLYIPAQRMRYMLCSWLGDLGDFNRERMNYWDSTSPKLIVPDEIIPRTA